MATKVQWDAGWTSRGVILSANSLATATLSALSSEIDNSVNLDQYGLLVFESTNVTPTANGYIEAYMLTAPDGTNYVNGSTAITPAVTNLVHVFPVGTTSVTSWRLASGLIAMHPAKTKFQLKNVCGATLTTAGTQLTLYTANDEIQTT